MASAGVTVLLVLLSTIVVLTVTAQGDRIITISNQCNEVVRVGRTGGRCVMANETMYPTTGCPPLQTRNPNDMFCYWDLPSPNGGPWQTQDLQPDQSIVLTLSNPDQNCGNGNVKWSGNIWGATGCDVSPGVCETAICFNAIAADNGQCPPYMGPVGPVTRAEFTLQSDATDFYDVTLLDGVNLPVEMKPSTQDVVSAAAAGQTGVAADYWCGNPGGILPTSTSLSGCSWSFNLTSIPGFGDQSTALTLVAKSTDPTAPNTDCTKDSDCLQGQVCGTLQQLNSVSGGPTPGLFPGKCGRFIGLWNANGICTWARGEQEPNTYPYELPFNCCFFNDLYGCSGEYSVSGYNCTPPDNMVCGCPMWGDVGINAPATFPCQCNNPKWNRRALPWIQWMKEACPTAYSFPFDDASSTFQCRNQNSNTVGYNITFCPGGQPLTRSLTNSAVGIGTCFSTIAVTAALLILATIMN